MRVDEQHCWGCLYANLAEISRDYAGGSNLRLLQEGLRLGDRLRKDSDHVEFALRLFSKSFVERQAVFAEVARGGDGHQKGVMLRVELRAGQGYRFADQRSGGGIACFC